MDQQLQKKTQFSSQVLRPHDNNTVPSKLSKAHFLSQSFATHDRGVYLQQSLVAMNVLTSQALKMKPSQNQVRFQKLN